MIVLHPLACLRRPPHQDKLDGRGRRGALEPPLPPPVRQAMRQRDAGRCLLNGRCLAPKAAVTRAKAAKVLYFMWVLAQPPKAENDQY